MSDIISLSQYKLPFCLWFLAEMKILNPQQSWKGSPWLELKCDLHRISLHFLVLMMSDAFKLYKHKLSFCLRFLAEIKILTPSALLERFSLARAEMQFALRFLALLHLDDVRRVWIVSMHTSMLLVISCPNYDLHLLSNAGKVLLRSSWSAICIPIPCIVAFWWWQTWSDYVNVNVHFT